MLKQERGDRTKCDSACQKLEVYKTFEDKVKEERINEQRDQQDLEARRLREEAERLNQPSQDQKKQVQPGSWVEINSPGDRWYTHEFCICFFINFA